MVAKSCEKNHLATRRFKETRRSILSCQRVGQAVEYGPCCKADGGWIAQLVEQRTENPRVPSSNLGPATIAFLSVLPWTSSVAQRVNYLQVNVSSCGPI